MSRSPTATTLGAIRRRLSPSIFAPARSRLWWLPTHLAVIGLATWQIARGIPLGWQLLCSVVIGLSFAGLAFVAHEALHGALTRKKTLRRLVGFIGFAPFCISPTLWVAWHNRVHHGNTNHPEDDPDANPTLTSYRTHRGVRVVTDLQRRSRGLLTLLVGLTGQSLHMLLVARQRRYLNRAHTVKAWCETLTALSVWVVSAWMVGPAGFVLSFLVPLLIANAIVMMHILTNHGLSPLDQHNDPLRGSLSVSVPRWFEWYTLGFGYHVEHHLIPGMSHRHGPAVQRVLRELYPDRYHCQPLSRALWAVCRAPRVYVGPTTLLDPRTGEQLQVGEMPTHFQVSRSSPPRRSELRSTPPRLALSSDPPSAL